MNTNPAPPYVAITRACPGNADAFPADTALAEQQVTRDMLIGALAAVMERTGAATVGALDASDLHIDALGEPVYAGDEAGYTDHWDHVYSARFALEAATRVAPPPSVRLYRGYTLHRAAEDLDDDVARGKQEVFARYAMFDGKIVRAPTPGGYLADIDGHVAGDYKLAASGSWQRREVAASTLAATAGALTTGAGTCLGSDLRAIDCGDAPAWELTADRGLRLLGTSSCVAIDAATSTAALAACNAGGTTVMPLDSGQLRAPGGGCLARRWWDACRFGVRSGSHRWSRDRRPARGAGLASATDVMCARAPVATRGRILAAGWLLFVVYAYPGMMSTDSVDQLLQARTGPIHDWFPPMMAYLWRWTDRVIAGPFPMLVLQSVLFLLGLDGILRRILSPRAAAIATSAILLFPPVLAPMAVIWKDSQMAGFLMAGTACLLSPLRSWRVAGLVLMSLATAMRYNALAATLPPIGLLFEWRPGAMRLRRYALALGAWLAVSLVAFGANAIVVDEHRYPWPQSIALHDMVGTLCGAGAISDEDARDLLDGAPLAIDHDFYHKLHKAYTPSAWWYLSHGDNRIFDVPESEEQRDGVAHAWWHTITAHPYAYLVHRWRVYKAMLGIGRGDPMAPVWSGFTENESQEDMIHHRAVHSAVQGAWEDALTWMDGSLVFRAHLYAILGVLLIPLCRRERLAGAILASGLLYEALLFPLAPSADFRYSHWLIACVVCVTVLLIARRATRRGAG